MTFGDSNFADMAAEFLFCVFFCLHFLKIAVSRGGRTVYIYLSLWISTKSLLTCIVIIPKTWMLPCVVGTTLHACKTERE